MPEADARLALILEWLLHDVGLDVERVEPASSDASFRRYVRVFHSLGSFIVMDAPPEREAVRPYIEVSAMLESFGIHVPHIHESDERRGFVLLEDLGSSAYLSRLAAGDDPDPLYGDALDALAEIQSRGTGAASALPPYDRETLMREMSLMPEWLCERHLELEMSREERELLAAAFQALANEALAQPRVFVHRDYHSRNLMVVEPRNPGVIDFQDAVCGPIGYDAVSLLKDCYIAWPRPRVLGWLGALRERLRARGLASAASSAQFTRWFDLVGAQRHLKVLGIFARLWHRDHKARYLADLPLTLAYLIETCALYPELADLGRFLSSRVAPRLAQANARCVTSLGH